jgi:hypothetical protein
MSPYTCQSLSEVRAFLGTVGVVWIFIKNFSLRTHPLIKLTWKDEPFIFGPEQIHVQEDLKTALLESPALRAIYYTSSAPVILAIDTSYIAVGFHLFQCNVTTPSQRYYKQFCSITLNNRESKYSQLKLEIYAIDYTSSAPVILAVDTSYIAVGFHLCQCDITTPSRRYYNRFCSIMLNDRESKYSQPKLEIYGLYCALRALRLYLIGVRNLVVEVDTRYIKGMLSNPDISPSASINRWIVTILTFHFDLVHVPGTHHGPDGLSRWPRQDGDEEDRDDEEDFVD